MSELKFSIINSEKWFSAIDVHSKAFNNRRYSNFISDYVLNDELVKEGIDFVTGELQITGTRGRPMKEYWLSYEFARTVFARVRTQEGNAYLKYLIGLQKKTELSELHTDDQIIKMVQLKEVFKYVCYQTDVEKLHQSKYVSEQNSKAAYADFHIYRNGILNLEPKVIEERIKQYCAEKLTNVRAKTKKDKLLILDKYETIRNAVWDFLELKGELNSLKIANLVKRMAEAEGTTLFRNNEADLFRSKEELPILSAITQKQIQ